MQRSLMPSCSFAAQVKACRLPQALPRQAGSCDEPVRVSTFPAPFWPSLSFFGSLPPNLEFPGITYITSIILHFRCALSQSFSPPINRFVNLSPTSDERAIFLFIAFIYLDTVTLLSSSGPHLPLRKNHTIIHQTWWSSSFSTRSRYLQQIANIIIKSISRSSSF